jgi:ankyrin repeat and BTB/POZ domain-containing protein 1
LHKFVLSARSPYFQKKLSSAPETTVWKLAHTIPAEVFHIALRYLYLGDVPADLGIGPNSFVTEEDVFKGIDKISKQLEIESLWEGILGGSDRRIARQRHQDEVTRGRDQLEAWYRENVLRHQIEVETTKVNDVKWTRDNAIFADVLLRADEDVEEDNFEDTTGQISLSQANGIPIGPREAKEASESGRTRKSVLYPAHRAMLIRSEYFLTMFSSQFQEAQVADYLRIVKVDCTPGVLEVVLNFLYTEKAEFPLDIAIDVLYAADMLFIEKLKTKAAVVISTLSDSRGGSLVDRTHIQSSPEDAEFEPINVYDVIRAAWLTRVQRLEEFAARYLANRLEDYIDEPEFEELIQESASRIQKREETDSIELLDDIRYYLSERFRLRFEDSGLEEMMDENGELSAGAAQAVSDAAVPANEKLIATDEAIDMTRQQPLSSADIDPNLDPFSNGQIRTLDGDIAGDEFASDAINYQLLLRKIDALLERLKLDA